MDNEKGKSRYKNKKICIVIFFSLVILAIVIAMQRSNKIKILGYLKNVSNIQTNDEQKNEVLNIQIKIKDKQKDGVTLSWEDFEDTNNQIVSYKIYKDNEYLDTVTKKEYKATNLDSTKEYNFSVEFLNSSDEVVTKKEINNVHTAKLIQYLSGEQVYKKDTYYIDAESVFVNSSIKFEAGCVLKFEKPSFNGLQGNKFEVEGNENEKTIIASSKYDGNYDESNEDFLLDYIGVRDDNFENIVFFSKSVRLRSSNSLQENIIVRNCNVVGKVFVEFFNNTKKQLIFEGNEIYSGEIKPQYISNASIKNNNIKNGNLGVFLNDDIKCNIRDNYGVNDNGAILKLNLSAITSSQNLENMLGTNNNSSTSQKAIDIQIDGFPVSDGTLNLPKANYLFSQTIYSSLTDINLDCNLSLEAGSQINILSNLNLNIRKKVELNGTLDKKIDVYCYDKKYSDTKIEKWGSFIVLANGELTAKYVNIYDSGKFKTSQNSYTYGFVSSNGKLNFDNIEVIDNNKDININGNGASITNSKLSSSINCKLSKENTVEAKKFVCNNNEFLDGTKITYVPVDGSISEIKNNTFNVTEQYLNLSLSRCLTNTVENVLNNITGNINQNESKYNIVIENIPENENISLNKDKYLFKFQDIKSNMEVEKGSYIYVEKKNYLNVYNNFILHGTSDEKIHIENANDEIFWNYIVVRETGRLEAENVVIKKAGRVNGTVAISNEGYAKLDNITFEECSNRSNIASKKTSTTEIYNTNLPNGLNLDEGYKSFKIQNSSIPSFKIQIPTTMEEVNNTVILNNNIDTAIEYTPNVFSEAIIKNNNIKQQGVSPVKVFALNANDNIFDNIGDNISPDIGKFTGIEIGSLPDIGYTLKKKAYYLNLKNPIKGIVNVSAGCCIKLFATNNMTLVGTINFNGTEEENVIITNTYDDGLNNIESDKLRGGGFSGSSNSTLRANHTKIKSGMGNITTAGNVYFDNVEFNENISGRIYFEKNYEFGSTISIKNSKILRLHLEGDKNRKFELVNNIINAGEDVGIYIKFNNEYGDNLQIIQNNVIKGNNYPVHIYVNYDYINLDGRYFSKILNNHNYEVPEKDYIYFTKNAYTRSFNILGKFPKNNYYINNDGITEVCEIEKGAKFKFYSPVVRGTLILNGTEEEPIELVNSGLSSYGTIIANHVNFVNSGMSIYDTLYMINCDMGSKNNGNLDISNAKSYFIRYNYLNKVYNGSKEKKDVRYNYWGEDIDKEDLSKFSNLIYIPYNETFLKTDFEIGDIIKEEKIEDRNLFGINGVNGYTGNYSTSYDDFNFNINNIDLNLSYTYNSQNDEIDLMGKGWTFGASSKLVNSIYDDKKYVYLPNGSVNIFTKKDGTNEYECMNSRNKLVENNNTFELVTLAMTRYVYNSNGYLYKVIDKYGNEINLTLDAKGKILALTTYGNKAYTFTYENEKISKITDPIGREARYLYDDKGLLCQTIGVDGKSTYFSYDNDGYLIKILEENDNNEHVIVNEMTYIEDKTSKKLKTLKNVSGKIESYEYTSSGTTITDQNSKTRKEIYNSKGYPTSTIEPGSLTTTATYSSVSGKTLYNQLTSKKDVTGKTTSYTYDNKGNIKTETVAGKSTNYVYNDKNSVTSKTDPNSNVVTYEYAQDGVTLLKEIYEEGSIVTYEYDEQATFKGLPSKKIDGKGNVTTYGYDACGNKISESDGNSNTTSYTYNDIGWVMSKTSPTGKVTNYEYDSNGNVIKVTEDGKSTVTQYNYKSNKTKEIDRNLNELVYEYDVSQNLTKEVDKQGATTVYEYDIYNNKVKETKPNQAVYMYEYDDANRNVKTSVDLDGQVKVLEEKTYVYSGGSKVITSKKYKDDTNYSTYIDRYNANGDVTSKELENSTYKKVYSNTYKVLSETNEIGKRTYYNYDNLDRLVKKYEEVEDDLYKITKYEYDLVGNVIKEYTSKEKISNNAEAEKYIITTYEYDNANNLVKTTTSSGEEIIYTYDGDNNKIKDKIKISDGNYKETDYEYNYAGKVTKKIEHVDKNSIYDFDNNVVSENEEENKIDIVTRYEYDGQNNLIKEILPSNEENSYKYNEYKYDKNGRQLKKDLYVREEPSQDDDIWGPVYVDRKMSESKAYDISGNVTRIQRKAYAISDVTYSYNKLNQKVMETDSKFHNTEYEYDLLGNLKSEKRPLNIVIMVGENPKYQKVLYEYNNLNQKIKKTQIYTEGEQAEEKIGPVTSYEYDKCGNLTKETINGNSTVYTYNKEGKVTKEIDANGNAKTYEYDALQNVTKVIDAKGVSTNYTYDDRNNLIKVDIAGVVQEENSYNLLNDKISSKDELGNEILYTYNNRGNLTKVTEVDTGYEVENKYYKDENVALKIDNSDLKVKYEYDWKDNVIKEESSKLDGTENITLKTSYDEVGNKISETDGNNNTTTYSYDSKDNLVQKTDANGNTTIYEYDRFDNMISETDHLGNKKTYVYDLLNRLIEKKDSYGNVIEKLEYDEQGRQTKSIDANNNSIKYEYDKVDNVVKIIDELESVETFEYDANYNKTKHTDKNGNVTKYEYDNKNNLTKVTNALNENTLYEYDNAGNVTKLTDGKGNITRYEYDKSSNETKKIDQLGNEEVKVYDKNGNLIKITTNNNDTFVYEYDVHGRMVKEKCGDKEAIIYTYDANDNVLTLGGITKTYDNLNRVTKVEQDGKQVNYEYDDNEKTRKVINSSGSIKTEKYDNENRLQKVIEDEEETEYIYNANGSLSKTKNPHNVTNYEYYKNNNLKSLTTKDLNDKILTYSQYEYDLNGNVTKEITNEKEKTYTYDNLNRIKTVNNGTSYTYDKAGNILTKTKADGTVTAYNYNAKNQLIKTVSQKNLEVIGQKSYEYDKNGNQTKEQENEKILSYIYNEKNELEEVKENENTIEKYKYDAEGKRIRREKNSDVRKYVYDGDKVIQEINIGGQERAKNTYGLSLIKRKADCNDELILSPDIDVDPEPQPELEGQPEEQSNSQKARRKTRSNTDESNVTNEEIFGNMGDNSNGESEGGTSEPPSIPGEGEISGGSETEIPGEIPGGNSGEVSGDDESSYPQEQLNIQTGYYLYNGHGDVISIVSTENKEYNKYEYDEYGQVEEEKEDLENVYKYAGYIQDKRTKNYYLNARYYNPAIQRFISEDTERGNKEDPLSLNLYTYTHNNPLIYKDPDGHSIIATALIAGILKGAAIGAAIDTGIHFIADMLDDGKINAGIKSYVGSAVEGAITGVGFGAVGAKASVLLKGTSTFISGAVGRATNNYINKKEIDVKDSLIGGITSSVATMTFGLGGKVPEKIAKSEKYLTYFFKGYNSTVAGDLVNQVLIKGNVDVTELGISGLFGGAVSSLGEKVSDVVGDYYKIKVKKGKSRNPYGKKGGKKHQAQIKKIARKLKRKHISHESEKRFDISNGEKSKRFADIVSLDGDKVLEAYQVGVINKNGTPVIREVRAIKDIMKSNIYRENPFDIIFIPYNVRKKEPIIYRKK